MGVIEEKIGYALYGLVPYLDLDILGIIAAFVPVVADLPLVEPIEIPDLSGFQKGLLLLLVVVPYFDLEWFKFFGFNPLDLAEKTGVADLDDAYWEEDSQGNQRQVMADGGTERGGVGDMTPDIPGQDTGKKAAGGLIKVLMILVPIIIIGGLVLTFAGDSGYGQLLANELGFQAAGTDTSEITDMGRSAISFIQCLGNAACFREWQFNNTHRPGSEARGEEYKLQIENYAVNDGYPLDIANRRPDDRVPVDFSVYNPRNGLKGINARDVAYRITVKGSDGLDLETECKTGWIGLGGEYAGDSIGENENGTILPGGFATPLGTHSNLDLKDCGLLQPALGINKRVKLQVAYDYSSQATLQVDAMSWEHMESLQERPSFEPSFTADTPVKTYLEVQSPITYRMNEGDPQSRIFDIRVGFETGADNIRYRVNVDDFEVYDSNETIDVSNTEDVGASHQCSDLQRVEGDQYNFSDDMADFLEERQESSWFESGAGPSPARCTMVLSDPGSISPTGETLTMRIDANYTVLLERQATDFEAINSQCSNVDYECPLLVPDSQADGNNLISKCDTDLRIDANNGCGARLGGDGDEDWVGISYALDDSIDEEIENGETAYLWSELTAGVQASEELQNFLDGANNLGPFWSSLSEGVGGEDVSDIENPDEVVIGLDSSDVEDELRSSGPKRFGAIITDNNDVEWTAHKLMVCNDYDTEEFREMWDDNNDGDLLYFNTMNTDCKNIQNTETVQAPSGIGFTGNYQIQTETYESVKKECDEDSIVVLEADSDNFQCYS